MDVVILVLKKFKINRKALSIEGYSRISNKSIENGWEVKRWSISNKCYSTLNLVLKVVKLSREQWT